MGFSLGVRPTSEVRGVDRTGLAGAAYNLVRLVRLLRPPAEKPPAAIA